MTDDYCDGIVGLLRTVNDLDLPLWADCTEDELATLKRASAVFQLARDEVYVLARYFFQRGDEPRILNAASSRPVETVEASLERRKYLARDQNGRYHLAAEARAAIENGSPYIIVNNAEEHKRLFELLSDMINRYFDEEDNVRSYDVVYLIRCSQNCDFARRFMQRYGHYDNDIAAFILVLASHFREAGPSPWRTPGGLTKMMQQSLSFSIDRLLSDGIAITAPENQDLDTRRTLGLPLLLAPEECGYLFSGLGEHVNFAGVLLQSGRLIRTTDIHEKTLFFDPETEEEVQFLVKAYSQDGYHKIASRLEANARRKTLACLLYGPPGTGKTELALQLAHSSGRDIIQADISKLTGSYVGESERNYRQLFLAYRYAVKVMDPIPILLLNEADAFLSSRVQVLRANEKYENNLQNILLEEFENFEGLLLATTNHTANIDEAFDRRFFMKVEIGIPNDETRLRIWEKAMPFLDSRQAVLLADWFTLTGAQIDNVATRYDILTALNGRSPTIDELTDLCRTEEKRITGRQRSKIGFVNDTHFTNKH